MTTKIIRPGLLVSLSSRISGGVRYDRKDLDATNAVVAVADTAAVSRWETTKVIDDPAEYERAVKIRGKCRNLISSVCATSDFGLLCPASKEFDLLRAIEEAKRVAAEHNASARRSFVSVYTITGRVSQDDAEAVRAISAEVRGLMDEMKRGITSGDVEGVREAARKAKGLATMLSDDAASKVNGAIEEARKAARDFVRRVEKGGEDIAAVLVETNMATIDAARVAFDLGDAAPVESLPVAAAPVEFAPAAPVEFAVDGKPVATSLATFEF